jgi:short-chain 2-methylacyl-CoA dehydrogenase
MLSFDLTPEQEAIRQTVREFAEGEIAPKAEKLDANEEFSVEITRKMFDLGLFGMFVPEEYGGSNVGYMAYILAVEELARVDASQAATVAAGNSLGVGPIYYFGSEKQKKEYLPRLTGKDGKFVAAFGLTEPGAGSDAQASKTKAELVNGQWVINGSKIFITNSTNPISLLTVVQAITGSRGPGKNELSCFIVPKGTPGFTPTTMHGKMLWRASDTGELYFEDCRVPEENMLGGRGEGFRQMMRTLDGGRLSIAAMALGGAQGAYEMALAYSKERKTFGQPISKHQAIAFRLADMATEIEAARLLVYKATRMRELNQPFEKYAAMAKLYASEVFNRVVNGAVQIFGGYGLMREYQIERFYRDQKILEIGEGTSEIQRLVISRHIGC